MLAHKETKKIRLVMIREKTLKVCVNHLSEFPGIAALLDIGVAHQL